MPTSEAKKRWYRENRDKVNRYKRAWAKRNRAKNTAYVLKHQRNLRNRALAEYGNACACCGETQSEFLSIDHIGGGGRKHRASIKGSIFAWLKKHEYPDGFRVLCHNCNFSTGIYGYCPHDEPFSTWASPSLIASKSSSRLCTRLST